MNCRASPAKIVLIEQTLIGQAVKVAAHKSFPLFSPASEIGNGYLTGSATPHINLARIIARIDGVSLELFQALNPQGKKVLNLECHYLDKEKDRIYIYQIKS